MNIWFHSQRIFPFFTVEIHHLAAAKRVMVFAAMHRNKVYWRFINERLTADSYKWLLSH